ncbi:hypothetical protein L8106_04886 [Lyngbya sp. PCC 8106]|nr:hypothetical protein L8106_04886 [Lyngbya sp. PCC 8106]
MVTWGEKIGSTGHPRANQRTVIKTFDQRDILEDD